MKDKSDVWIVGYTKPNFEKKVADNFCKQGIESIAPTQKQLKQWSDRKKWVDVVLFKSYIFVRKLEFLKMKGKVSFPDGFMKWISINRKPSIVTAEEMQTIQRICLSENKIEIEAGEIAEGKTIEIKEGILKGIKGKIIKNKSNKHLTLWIEALNCTMKIKL